MARHRVELAVGHSHEEALEQESKQQPFCKPTCIGRPFSVDGIEYQDVQEVGVKNEKPHKFHER